jgi:hypothetical protein
MLSFPLNSEGRRKYAEFSGIIERIMARVHESGVPLVVMAVPNRVAAAVVSNHATLEGTDGREFGRHIGKIAAQYGAIPVDATPEFAKYPHAETLFYPVDNHPTGQAHALLARTLAARLTDGTIPQLAACRSTRAGIH